MTHTPLIIAHRGESYDVTENTLSAINLAWENGADGVEIDVQLSKDNEVVVIHDKNTKRLSGENHLVKSLSVEALKSLDIRTKRVRKHFTEKIPLLSEIISTLPAGKLLFIEIKCGTEIIPALKTVVNRSKVNKNQVKLIGFNIKTMSAVKNNFPNHEVFFIKRIHIERIISRKSLWDNLISKIKQHSLDGINLAYTRLLTSEVVNKFKHSKLKIYVWTINNHRKALRLIDMNVDGFISDRVGYIKEKIAQ
jgi:glycerophosphoryl diester phosphodiesterase